MTRWRRIPRGTAQYGPSTSASDTLPPQPSSTRLSARFGRDQLTSDEVALIEVAAARVVAGHTGQVRTTLGPVHCRGEKPNMLVIDRAGLPRAMIRMPGTANVDPHVIAARIQQAVLSMGPDNHALDAQQP